MIKRNFFPLVIFMAAALIFGTAWADEVIISNGLAGFSGSGGAHQDGEGALPGLVDGLRQRRTQAGSPLPHGLPVTKVAGLSADDQHDEQHLKDVQFCIIQFAPKETGADRIDERCPFECRF